MTTKDEALRMALKKAFDLGKRYWSWADSEYSSHWKKADVAKEQFDQLIDDTIREVLAQPEQEPVAWLHTKIEGVAVPHRPADLDKHPDRWEALYKTPSPCPTCEALARTVMLDQTSYDTTPPQRKPLTDEEIVLIVAECASSHQHTDIHLARAIEAAHGIKRLV